MSLRKKPFSFQKLLHYIDTNRPLDLVTWNGLAIESTSGGMNNLVYRVRGDDFDYAVKFTIKDERNRARREYVALRALREAGLTIAPEAILLDEDNFSLPVVVQTWIEGSRSQSIPKSRLDWQMITAHFASIHSLKQTGTHNRLEDAVVNFRNGSQGKARVFENAGKIPTEDRSEIVNELLNWFEKWEPPVFPESILTLCRVDPNWRNFIVQENQYVSVDWENSGWGDPAFEIADMMAHPEYEKVSAEDWEFVIQTYIELTNEPACKIRIETYYLQMLMWWVIRWLRYLYEIPRGLDERLVKRPDNWKLEMDKKYAAYLERLQARISAL